MCLSAFTFIDLFAGIGGLRLAAEKSGGTCLFTSEWDRFANQTYSANFHNDQIFGDIQKIDERAVPGHELLLAGFPCQPFSIAGVSKKNSLGRAHGFMDQTQGTLFFDIVRIIEYHQPKAFLLENVKNLLSHDKGRTFSIIQACLEDDLGYSFSAKVIDAAHFLPQHRERIVMVGFRDGYEFDFDSLILPVKNEIKLSTILHPQDGTEQAEEPYTLGPDAKVNPKYTISDKLWDYLQAYAQKHKQRGNGFGFGLVTEDSVARTLSARYYKDGSEILIAQQGKNPRRLTPRECARLMGFPDTFEIPVSDTQAYKQFGNSVAVPVFEKVLNDLLQRL
ncbi:DNA (cytosine-5-)-methyltransferase [Litorivicinus sp.]|nr:DNA (cytosine-5-)-methyltransferase [Litorivicinus sp.]